MIRGIYDGLNLKYVPPFVTCKRCSGRGNYEKIADDKPRMPIHIAGPMPEATDWVCRVVTVDCEQCAGLGRHRAKVPTRVRVFQDGREIGTLPSLTPELNGPSVFVQIRDGDYKPTVKDDEVVLIACSRLGSGDITAIKGFQPTEEMAPYYKRNKEFEEFDRLAAEMLRKK